MKTVVMFATGAILTSQAMAFDEFNSYRWNRTNALSGSTAVDTKPWFEWWYYKIVLPESGESFYFVYGVVNPWDQNHTSPASKSYVGMGDFTQKIIYEENFPVNDFSASYQQTFVAVANNLATDQQVTGSITDKNALTASWNFSIARRWTFNATGWATGRGLTNIEWYPAQADALCTGEIQSNGIVHRFVDSPCYQDRNWGNSFPAWWTWIVSNHFENNPETTLSIGGGKPKVFNRFEPIEGVAIGLKHRGKEYAFRPNDLHKVKVDVLFGKWEVTGENLRHKIEISAWAPEDAFMDLQFMTPQGEIFHDYETLTGEVKVRLYERTGVLGMQWRLIDTLFSRYAGIEYGSQDEYGLSALQNTSLSLYSSQE